jgi:hypothetical protein
LTLLVPPDAEMDEIRNLAHQMLEEIGEGFSIARSL